MARTTWFLGGAALLSASSFWLALGGRPSSEQQRLRMARMEAELATVRGEMRASRQRTVIAVAERTSVGEGAPVFAMAAPDAPAVEREPNQAEEAYRASPPGLEERLAAEPFDARWSRDAEAQARETLTAKVEGTSVVDVSCGSTLCRMRLEHEHGDAQGTLATAIAAEPPFASGAAYDYGADGEHRSTTVYVARAGYDLYGLPERNEAPSGE